MPWSELHPPNHHRSLLLSLALDPQRLARLVRMQ